MAKLGVSLYPAPYGGGGDPTGIRYRDAVDLGRRAEEAGFDGVFVVEAGAAINDGMATALAIAAATRRITVGTGIAHPYHRHPALLGNGAVAVDEISGGRFILGIGTSNREMIEALGIAWREPRQVLRETTGWLRQVFAGEQRPGLGAPFRPALHPIPIHFAGLALETAELAGEIADGLMLYLASRARYRQMVSRMAAAAGRAGRDPGAVTLLIPAFVAGDLDAARAAARAFVGTTIARPLYTKFFRRSGFAAEADAATAALARGDRAAIVASVSDRLLDEVCLVGPVARCRERLAVLREAGVSYPIVAPHPVGQDMVTAARQLIEAFAPR